jgi:photosystem II stability/assembly factor-like uncharacterized protein
VTGLCLDPFEPDRLYARSDVAGCFVSDDRGAHWETRNAGLRAAHEQMVHAFVPSPHVPGLVLRCSGDARGGRTYGSIHRSLDHGRTWTGITADVDFYGNGPTRMYGEICAFDPHTRGRVVVGGYRAGLWSSDDDGLTWQRRGLTGERIGCVVFHPTVPGLVYAGTVGDRGLSGLRYLGADRPISDVLLEHGDVPRGSQGRLYVSQDGGDTWRLRFERPDWSVNGLGLEPAGPSLVLAATMDGLWRSSDGGETFAKCDLGPEADTQLDHVSADPHRPGRFITSPHLDGRDLPLYETSDHGCTWRRLKQTYALADLSDYPDYINDPTLIGQAISRAVFDPRDPDVFYITGYYGVSVTHDNGRTFSGQGFAGIETSCVESIVADRTTGLIYAALTDHEPAASQDGGRTYTSFTGGPKPTAALAISPHEPEIVLWSSGGKRRHNDRALILRSTRGGSDPEVVLTIMGHRFVQALAADSHVRGRFFAFVDGDIDGASDDTAGLFRTDDMGSTWHRIGSPFPDTVHRVPVEEDWIESELLPVVVYQKRNAAGANQLLACDPQVAGRLYVGEWTTGLYRSDDAGKTWGRADTGLPFGRSRAGVLSQVLTDPERAGWVYAGFTAHGLWRSVDSGRHWKRITPDDTLNASSVALLGERIVIACEPMWWTSTPARILISEDLGAHWDDIHPDEYGAVRWKGITLDSHGTVHASSCGNGIFTADLS